MSNPRPLDLCTVITCTVFSAVPERKVLERKNDIKASSPPESVASNSSHASPSLDSISRENPSSFSTPDFSGERMKSLYSLNSAEYPPHAIAARAPAQKPASKPRQNARTGVISSIAADAVSDGCARRFTICANGGTTMLPAQMRMSSSPAIGICTESSEALRRT